MSASFPSSRNSAAWAPRSNCMVPENSAAVGLEMIRAVAIDVDGVLTDGGLWWGPGGEEWKRFCFADIMGVSLARRAGLILALISGENSPLVDRYAEKMLIRHVAKGCRDKAGALREFAAATGVKLTEVCFMGDDVNDLPAMAIAGLSAAPANASSVVLERANFIARASGGNGAVRELIDSLLTARGLTAQEVFTRE
jgi:3-deoxy-D-manno-octulosonate 8-phosphate phosphatase (KDO 8-P phosphatase)